jgi:hypothetical protein
MKVFVYVDTRKQVGDTDHLKYLLMLKPQRPGLRKTILKA